VFVTSRTLIQPPQASQATGARLSERGITKCHVRLKFLTLNLIVTAQ
jgi:hypothetical protein